MYVFYKTSGTFVLLNLKKVWMYRFIGSSCERKEKKFFCKFLLHLQPASTKRDCKENLCSRKSYLCIVCYDDETLTWMENFETDVKIIFQLSHNTRKNKIERNKIFMPFCKITKHYFSLFSLFENFISENFVFPLVTCYFDFFTLILIIEN